MIRRLAATTLLLLPLLCATIAAGDSRLYGVVIDESGGVLPGVTVVATARDGTAAATVTNVVGEYHFNGVHAGPVTLTFELEGFSSASVDVVAKADGDLRVATQRLGLAARAETVEVLGTAPAMAPPAPPRATLPPAPPPPAIVPVPPHDRDSVCGPAKAPAAAASLGSIRGRRYAEDKGLYTKDDEVIVDGGALNGLAVGQNVVARRTYHVVDEPNGPIGEHTAGLLQIVAAGERASIAVVVYACDEVMRGDQIAWFRPEPLRPAEPAGTPTFDDPARILFADAGQLVGAPRRMMVIDRGRDRGVHAGQPLTLFRRSRLGGSAPQIVGQAVVVAVRDDSATIRIERATDAILFGDLAAPDKQASARTRR
jgi:Carboxypeptidase regulatory-like domain